MADCDLLLSPRNGYLHSGNINIKEKNEQVSMSVGNKIKESMYKNISVILVIDEVSIIIRGNVAEQQDKIISSSSNL